MSQVTHAGFSLRTAVRSHRVVMLAGLLALAATAAIVLALAIGGSSHKNGGTPVTPGTHQLGPDVRYDGGPEEGSSNAAASGPNVRYDGGPEEGSAATPISGR
jgi:hypothetical protein